ncbi:UNVERIFIED_CONTAM: hypothetical protein GTU68_022289 [Idotea baltica]|nr:hypothetical protein [Idotea baltica]
MDRTGVKETVETQHGPITIAVAGDRSKPVILTYHDLGPTMSPIPVSVFHGIPRHEGFDELLLRGSCKRSRARTGFIDPSRKLRIPHHGGTRRDDTVRQESRRIQNFYRLRRRTRR